MWCGIVSVLLPRPSEERLALASNILLAASPGSSDRRSGNDYFSLGDVLPAFSSLTSDEERERKAECSAPGTYHVIMVPDSFSSLPDYADDGERPKSTVTETVYSVTNSPVGVIKTQNDASDDPNTVILKTFEDVTRRSSCTGRISRVSPTSESSDPICSLSLSPPLNSFPSPVLDEEYGSPSFIVDSCMDHQAPQRLQQSTLYAHFRHVVWKQLFPHDRSLDGTHGFDRSGMTLSVAFLEREAARFPPVRYVTFLSA